MCKHLPPPPKYYSKHTLSQVPPPYQTIIIIPSTVISPIPSSPLTSLLLQAQVHPLYIIATASTVPH